jgi:hypothetical protein
MIPSIYQAFQQAVPTPTLSSCAPNRKRPVCPVPFLAVYSCVAGSGYISRSRDRECRRRSAPGYSFFWLVPLLYYNT